MELMDSQMNLKRLPSFSWIYHCQYINFLYLDYNQFTVGLKHPLPSNATHVAWDKIEDTVSILITETFIEIHSFNSVKSIKDHLRPTYSFVLFIYTCIAAPWSFFFGIPWTWDLTFTSRPVRHVSFLIQKIIKVFRFIFRKH